MTRREILSGFVLSSDFRSFLALQPDAVLVEVTGTQGSTPREAGTFMLVSAKRVWGTIGGGHFEFIAIGNARQMLAGTGGTDVMDIALGPEIGQCCGGRTQLRFRRVTDAVSDELEKKQEDEAERLPEVYVFGAGHVGRALAAALAPLPLSVTVIETRRDELANLPVSTKSLLVPMPEALVKDIPAGAALVILTHDHALDFLIASEALARTDLAYVGMIGSATKRATFANWLSREAGGERSWLTRLTLPIGGSAVKDKRPEVIAAMTAAEILAALAAYREPSSS
ncbi:xanthine dehydrogenase accessory factor [Rhizobium sp. BK529]|uniref:xanthine dehydrogenase accessory protein XdhC n=1 Tax=unclassified Rhizobium TaxID=2613769 RepID=UPI001044B2B5|nr:MULTISPECIES: xanthine dehydrogenase accessory protein XdhC [unclassified Rhizobium]MBB3589968.1 xanthine dehydrogenase accessory factor [Rhizobium sp. BK529]TCS04664.1 molybdenum cofactor sulfurylase [Rhizobium sp. BK418]